ncbi:hypothetical protein V3391_05105 [Luteimonas sp. SMYT11W]|uniref:Uncharacterized protein n=1 Tax=Luteimonas flava TaxID=3115822 RepID=A0ABU7WC98_9GAMM
MAESQFKAELFVEVLTVAIDAEIVILRGAAAARTNAQDNLGAAIENSCAAPSPGWPIADARRSAGQHLHQVESPHRCTRSARAPVELVSQQRIRSNLCLSVQGHF